MPANPKVQQPTRLLILLLSLVLFGFFSILASQFIVQRLSQKTAGWSTDKHVEIHMARNLDMHIKEIQADFFLLPTLNIRAEQEVINRALLSHISKASETLHLLKQGGDITPPEAITLLFDLPANSRFTFTPDKNVQRLSIINNIQDLLLQIKKDLSRIDLLLVIYNSNSPEKRLKSIDSLITILNKEKEIFSQLSSQTGVFISTSHYLLEKIQQESKSKIKRYQLIGLLVAGTTFILVAFLGSRLIVQIINTTRILRITRDNMASDYTKQKALNTILAITHDPLSLEEKLTKSLHIILQSLFSSSIGEGAIFLCDHSLQKISLQAQQGMNEQLPCLKNHGTSFGSCLCSIAAVSGESIECDSNDPRHRMSYKGMPSHDHYCLPIKAEGKTLGVLLIQLGKDISLPQSDKKFLGAVGHAIAALIRQQLSEEKLAKSELDRVALFKSSNEAILLLKNNEVIQCNKAAAQLFELENQDEIISTSPIELLALHEEGASIQQFLSLLNIAMQQGTARGEYLLKRRDNSTFEADLTFTPILLYGSNILYLVIRDISAKKQEEQALLAAKKQAENANRAKSNFLAAMSHEIRTPLNAILGMTLLTLNKTLEPEIKEDIEIIHTAADSLMALINDTLDITKIEEGQLLLEEKPFSLQDLVAKLNAIFAEQFRAANITFEVTIADGTPLHLIGDAMRISQILNNLLTNALKFTMAGGEVTVTMSSPHHDEKNAVIQFTTKDSGIGISEETLPLIFDEFTQAGTSRQFGGLGLGLAISKRLADIMGGKLWATSLPHQGSTFFFEINVPRSLEKPEINSAATSTSSGFFRQAKALHQASILVVEDNDINRKVILQILETVGALPDHAQNGREAVEKMSEQYQAVLMDIEMPVLDGIQATREIRMKKRFADIPIIAMTAHAMVDDRRRCLDAGMNDYLTKPIDPAHFIDVLEKWLNPESKKVLLSQKEVPFKASDQHPHSLVQERVVLDMGTAITKMGGDKNLYKEILGDFLTLHSGTCATIGHALAQGNLEKALETAHLLKGVASTLRAYDLQTQANEMEQMLRQGITDEEKLQEALANLTTSTDRLLARIKELIGEKRQVGESKELRI